MRIGIDLGGTKIAGVVLDGDRVVTTRRIATPRGDYPGTVKAIAGLVTALEADARTRCRVGIGMPGAISRASGLVKNANSTWLNGQPFQRDLEAALGRDVRLANDANCLAVSEAAGGAAAGARVVFAVILGTGTGGGIALEGRVHDGPNAIAGEWGHMPLPWPRDEERPGPACYCGRTGCMETFVSGPGLAADHARVTGETLAAETIVARAGAGDSGAAETLARHRDRLARGLGVVANILDPDVIVLGGGVSAIPGLAEALPAAIAPCAFTDRFDTPVLRARFGPDSGVRGAARLWPDVP